MSPAASPEVGSTVRARARFVRALPWCVVGSAVVTLTPIVLFPDILAAHLPTFIVLLGYSIAFARRARTGQSVSPVAIAAVVGGLGTSVALLLVPAMGMLEDPTSVAFYFITWFVVPMLALVGSGLAALLVGFARLVSRRRRNA